MKAIVITMIGDVIAELHGKITGERIVRSHHGVLKVEKTMESKGKVLGMDVTLIATFKVMERPQGGMYAEGNGMLMTTTRDKVSLHGSGISIAGKTAMNMRGVRYAQSASPAFSRLNNVALVYEIEIMPDGTVRDKWWEWK